MKNKDFLASNVNKQRFICLLTASLKEAVCQVVQAREDADVSIAQTTLKSAKAKDTVFVGDDTDLLDFQIYHADKTSNDVYFKPGKYHIGEGVEHKKN